jgi:hypothetical protein
MSSASSSSSASPEGSINSDSNQTTATDKKIRQLFASKSHCNDDLNEYASDTSSEATRGMQSLSKIVAIHIVTQFSLIF